MRQRQRHFTPQSAVEWIAKLFCLTQRKERECSHIDCFGSLSEGDKYLILQACRHVLEQSAKDLEQINIYDVYEDICLPYVFQELKQMAKVATGHPAILGAHLAAAGMTYTVIIAYSEPQLR